LDLFEDVLSFRKGRRYQWGFVVKFDLEEKTFERVRKGFNFIKYYKFFFVQGNK